MTVTVRLVRNDFGKIAAALPEKAAAAVKETAEGIADAARAAAPFGEIAAAIGVESEDELHQVVTMDLWWGGFWEYGTRDFGARPYLTPATEQFHGPFVAGAARALRP